MSLSFEYHCLSQTLLLRFFPYLNVTEHRNQLEEIWNVIFRGLAMIGRRDSHLLMNLHSEFQRWFDTVHNFGTILRLARSLSDSASQPIKNNSLAFALTNKVCLLILLLNLLSSRIYLYIGFYICTLFCLVWRICNCFDVWTSRKIIYHGWFFVFGLVIFHNKHHRNNWWNSTLCRTLSTDCCKYAQSAFKSTISFKMWEIYNFGTSTNWCQSFSIVERY